MLKIVATSQTPNGPQSTLYLGLERANTDRLHDNKPILIDMAELPKSFDRIVILAGESIADVYDDLRAIGLPMPDQTPSS